MGLYCDNPMTGESSLREITTADESCSRQKCENVTSRNEFAFQVVVAYLLKFRHFWLIRTLPSQSRSDPRYVVHVGHSLTVFLGTLS